MFQLYMICFSFLIFFGNHLHYCTPWGTCLSWLLRTRLVLWIRYAGDCGQLVHQTLLNCMYCMHACTYETCVHNLSYILDDTIISHNTLKDSLTWNIYPEFRSFPNNGISKKFEFEYIVLTLPPRCSFYLCYWWYGPIWASTLPWRTAEPTHKLWIICLVVDSMQYDE